MAKKDPSYQVEFAVATADRLQGQAADLFAYWDDARGERVAPPWRTFDWGRVPAKLIPWCAVVDVRHGEAVDFVYRFWGTARARMQGNDYTGRSIRDFQPSVIGEKASREYQWVVDRAQPLHIVTDGMRNHRAEPFSYEFLRLPFSDDGTRIDNILGVGVYDGPSFRSAFKYYGTYPVEAPRQSP